MTNSLCGRINFGVKGYSLTLGLVALTSFFVGMHVENYISSRFSEERVVSREVDSNGDGKKDKTVFRIEGKDYSLEYNKIGEPVLIPYSSHLK
jgi:hypothetical protein